MHGRVESGAGQASHTRLLQVGAPPLFILLWSSGFIFVKIALAYTNPLTLLAVRYALVVALLLPAVLLLRLPWPRGIAWLHLIAVGLLVQAGHFASVNLALSHGFSPGAASLITSLQPILVGLLAPWLAGERVSARRWLGLALGLAGAAVVILARSALGAMPLLGLFFSVLGLATITGGTLYERRFGTRTHPITASLIQCGVALAAMLPLAAVLEPMRFVLAPGLVVAMTYLVLANSILALSLLFTMVRLGEASRVSSLFFLVPPTTALLAWAALGERVQPLAWVGLAISAAGVAIVTLERRPRA